MANSKSTLWFLAASSSAIGIHVILPDLGMNGIKNKILPAKISLGMITNINIAIRDMINEYFCNPCCQNHMSPYLLKNSNECAIAHRL